MEDHTDEDFFDKLVDDDFGLTNSESRVGEGSDSDDLKAFADLSVEETSGKASKEETAESSNPITEKDPGAFDKLAASENEKRESVSETPSGTPKSSVKEIGWNSFQNDIAPTGFQAFGSESDFFNTVNDSAEDFFEKIDDKANLAAQKPFESPQTPPIEENGPHRQVEDVQNSNDVVSWENMYPGWKYDSATGQWYQVDSFEMGADLQDQKADNSEINYSQQVTEPSSVTTYVAESAAQNVNNWNQVTTSTTSSNGYPDHMYFDPQYPGWYYDMLTQEWRTLDSYTANHQPSGAATFPNSSQNEMAFAGNITHYGGSMNGGIMHPNNQGHQWNDGYNNGYNHQAQDAWKPNGDVVSNYDVNKQYSENYGVNNFADRTEKTFQSYEAIHQPVNQYNVNQMGYTNSYYGAQTSMAAPQFSYGANSAYSCDGRPAHALVSFGFGGKLIVMKDKSSTYAANSHEDTSTGSIHVLNLMEVVGESKSDCGYFQALCHQSFPGPLVGGSVGNKEMNKWIDERISACESPDMDYTKKGSLKLLLSLLKIALQHYGKLRSPFGVDAASRESDSSEAAVAKLFASCKRTNSYPHCLQNFPLDGQIQEIASQVQNLLVSGNSKEALKCAQDGQLWGPALVLSSQLGNQFFVDTIKQMALRQLVPGSPLRTLCLLIAGEPKEVFSSTPAYNPVNVSPFNQLGESNVVLDDWEENLAVIAANRTKDDELVITHLGDCLWKDRGEVIGAHICYLVAEANFELYSDSARLCLLAADHWNYPRTYASPEAIQRTELYEYTKVLGNSQFVLHSFQPYKLVYAYMLAEVGKVSESLKYCQALLKSLKSRSPEVDTWRQLVSSLEERLKTHQQGGYGGNLAPAKLGKLLLKGFDSLAHRVVGGLPPPAPSVHAQNDGFNGPATVPRVSTSQSTMAMSSLVSSPSSEKVSDDGRKIIHNRSVSEPDFGRTKEAPSSAEQNKGSSRFSQLFQKTFGLIKPRSDKQAKLGGTNKFYYDEKLKRWVEEGAEPPPEAAALPPPPTTSFQNGTKDYNLISALQNDAASAAREGNAMPTDFTSHTPPLSAGSNQYSARARVGVRARYVDTFNPGAKPGGGGFNAAAATSLMHPPVQPMKPAANFFVPSAATSSEFSMEAIAESSQEASGGEMGPSAFSVQRFPSMGNMGASETASHSRRTASWSGGLNEPFRPMENGNAFGEEHLQEVDL